VTNALGPTDLDLTRIGLGKWVLRDPDAPAACGLGNFEPIASRTLRSDGTLTLTCLQDTECVRGPMNEFRFY